MYVQHVNKCEHYNFVAQVTLGILPKSKTKHEDMISIMETLPRYMYVPSATTVEHLDIPGLLSEFVTQ